jgi:hypothetical protein
MALLLTEPPMLIDYIVALAEHLGVDTRPPLDTKFGYGISYAGWLMGEIERVTRLPANGLQLGARYRQAHAMALAMEPTA